MLSKIASFFLDVVMLFTEILIIVLFLGLWCDIGVIIFVTISEIMVCALFLAFSNLLPMVGHIQQKSFFLLKILAFFCYHFESVQSCQKVAEKRVKKPLP